MKRFVIRVLLVCVLAGIGTWCFFSGKAYDIVLENIPSTVNGQTVEPFEAVNAYIDTDPSPILLLDGDRMVATAIGLKHTIRIDILDEDDNVLESRTATFTTTSLGRHMSLNVPQLFAGTSAKK